jgi:hypothetical protein
MGLCGDPGMLSGDTGGFAVGVASVLGRSALGLGSVAGATLEGGLPVGSGSVITDAVVGVVPLGEDLAQTQLRCPRHMLEDVGAEDLWQAICILGG